MATKSLDPAQARAQQETSLNLNQTIDIQNIMNDILISDLDYDTSLALTVQGRCPSVSHGLHSIRKGHKVCANCGIKSINLIAKKGECCPQITGFQHEPMSANGYDVRGTRGPSLITANSGTEAAEIYLQD